MIIFTIEKLDDGTFLAKKFQENSIVLTMGTEYIIGPFEKAEEAVDELDNVCKGIVSDREYLYRKEDHAS